VFDLIIEIKYGGTKGTKAAHTANARKAAAKNTKTATATKKSTTPKAKSTTVATVAKTVAATAEANNAQEGAEKEG